MLDFDLLTVLVLMLVVASSIALSADAIRAGSHMHNVRVVASHAVG